MSIAINPRLLAPGRDLRALLVKWVVALLLPIIFFTFIWNGEIILNDLWRNLLLDPPARTLFRDPGTLVQVGIFMLLLYAVVMALAGYVVAADSGRRRALEVWFDVLFYVCVPILLIVMVKHLLVGLGLSLVIIPLYGVVRGVVRKMIGYVPPSEAEEIQGLDAGQRALLVQKGRSGGFWFAIALAVLWLVMDTLFYFSGVLVDVLWIWIGARTVLFPVLGYLLGGLGGYVAVRRSLKLNAIGEAGGENGETNGNGKKGLVRRLQSLSKGRAVEEARNLVPNDVPLQSRGAWYFYLLLLIAFALLYPALDRGLFDPLTTSRLTSYGDLGYYIILALGLNIVVGFAGLLDLGYVAFFVLGTYAWALVGSDQFTVLTNLVIDHHLLPWLFWPMLIVAALFAALWGVLLGAPTLRLRGDYLAIVTLGFGEIIPIVFLQLEHVTRGSIGITGIAAPVSPAIPPILPAIEWSNTNPTPFYYLILALIVFTIFTNLRLRDSRLGRAWIAIREDEIAAVSSGINLVKTKLFAFGAGAFFSGIAGTYHAAKLGTVTPKDFNSTDSIMFLAMVVIGGIGSIPGVILGAVVVYSLNVLIIPQLDSMAQNSSNFLHFIRVWLPDFRFQNVRFLVFGALLVLIMIFRPEGLVPSARRRRELHQSQEENPEVGALDANPASPGFEEQISVE